MPLLNRNCAQRILSVRIIIASGTVLGAPIVRVLAEKGSSEKVGSVAELVDRWSNRELNLGGKSSLMRSEPVLLWQ